MRCTSTECHMFRVEILALQDLLGARDLQHRRRWPKVGASSSLGDQEQLYRHLKVEAQTRKSYMLGCQACQFLSLHTMGLVPQPKAEVP